MFVIFCGGLQLLKCHRVAVSRYKGIWFNIIRESYCDKAMYNLVEKTEAGISPSLLQATPTLSCNYV